ncbi:MAG: hypothetical protein AB7V26_03125 [Lysobacterales bacterium]
MAHHVITASEDWWGRRVLRFSRLALLVSLTATLLTYAAGWILSKAESCVAYIELPAPITFFFGLLIVGISASVMSFAALLEQHLAARLVPVFRIFVFYALPLALALSFLAFEYVPLVTTLLEDPDIFCD